MTKKPLPPHSEAKIKLLKAYMEAYLGVIGNDPHTDRIFLADLFCGPGSYLDDKVGSPVEIGRMLAAMHNRNPRAPITEFLFNDVKSSNVENVESYLRPIEAKHPKIKLIPSVKNAASLLPYLLAEQHTNAPNSKRFYFVDPFGYSQISLQEVFSLLKVKGSELLLFQPSSFMFRFSEKGTPEALSSYLEELSQGTPWPQGLTIMEYIQHIKKLFRQKLNRSHYVDSFSIQKDANTVFCLFFFTMHIRGFEKMLEAKWRFNGDTGQGWHYTSAYGVDELFSQSIPQTQILQYAIENLLASGPATNLDIYRSTLEMGFLPKHSTEILSSMQKEGRIEVEPKPPRKGVFYLGYENHKNRDGKFRISKVN
jgi:three-Cys-motif partner protein